jgi:hypothetical protein
VNFRHEQSGTLAGIFSVFVIRKNTEDDPNKEYYTDFNTDISLITFSVDSQIMPDNTYQGEIMKISLGDNSVRDMEYIFEGSPGQLILVQSNTVIPRRDPLPDGNITLSINKQDQAFKEYQISIGTMIANDPSHIEAEEIQGWLLVDQSPNLDQQVYFNFCAIRKRMPNEKPAQLQPEDMFY